MVSRFCRPPGNGLTLEGAVPSEQDSQPKPAKRARTSFTAEQLQVPPSPAHLPASTQAVGGASKWAGLCGTFDSTPSC